VPAGWPYNTPATMHSGRYTLSGPSGRYSEPPCSLALPVAASEASCWGQRDRVIVECRHPKQAPRWAAPTAIAPYSKTRLVASQRRPTSMPVFSSLNSLYEGRTGSKPVYRAGFLQDGCCDDSAIWPARKRDRAIRTHQLAMSTLLAAFCVLLAAITLPSASFANPLPTGASRVVSEVSIVQARPGLTLRIRRQPTLTPAHPPIENNSALKEMAEQAATRHTLPTDYFLRLIRQESGFNPNSVSPAGAQGIAQFMPGTASDRGLKDPFDPAEALPKSAELLNELRTQFGNLGLAAAAYNAGPERVRRWLAGKSQLPQETVDYVRVITGHDAVDWAKSNDMAINPGPDPFGIPSRPLFNRLSWEAQLLATLQATPSAESTLPTRPTLSSKRGELSLCSHCIVQSAY
jgi:soluble lytic murein transglycosylase-like protein